jgi:hypothetical protein
MTNEDWALLLQAFDEWPFAPEVHTALLPEGNITESFLGLADYRWDDPVRLDICNTEQRRLLIIVLLTALPALSYVVRLGGIKGRLPHGYLRNDCYAAILLPYNPNVLILNRDEYVTRNHVIA